MFTIHGIAGDLVAVDAGVGAGVALRRRTPLLGEHV